MRLTGLSDRSLTVQSIRAMHDAAQDTASVDDVDRELGIIRE